LSMTSDTFAKSSGSGVFNARGELVATVARGGTDYEYRMDEDCFVARRVSSDPDPSQAEQASYVTPAFAALCEAGWASEALCGKASVCGDAQCSIDEHAGACPEDCPAAQPFQVAGPAGGVASSAGGGDCALARGRSLESEHVGFSLGLPLALLFRRR